MILEASHYDKIEWSPKTVSPGEFINEPKEKRKTRVGEQRSIKLRAPCRIDVGLIDYSALKFTDNNDYKAGEMSFACTKYTEVEVTLLHDAEIKISSERELIARHIALLLKNSTDYVGGFEITTKAHRYRHIGFGSSAVLMETIAVAINKLLGNPFSEKELRNLIAYNFVEESDSSSGMLFPGASTGGSFNTIVNGGFCITSSDCELIFRSEIPKNMYFVVGTPQVGVKGPEASETDVNCMGWERHNERVNAAKSCLWILTEIMPYWVKGEYTKVGNAFYNYTLFGGKAMQMLFYRCDIAGILFELKEAGLEGGWMTSAGPSLVAFTQDRRKVEVAKMIFKRRGCRQILTVRGDNNGIVEQ